MCNEDRLLWLFKLINLLIINDLQSASNKNVIDLLMKNTGFLAGETEAEPNVMGLFQKI
jgi:hypothetical protein